MNVLRDLSLILLASGTFIFTLIPLALFGGLAYGMWWLLKHENLPSWLYMIHEYVSLGLSYVERAMQALVKPVMRVHTTLANIQGWLEYLRMKNRE